MADSIVGSVIEYLTSDDESLRNIALNWLCEGYLDDPQIAQVAFSQFDSRTPETAYSSFPLLSYFPLSDEQIMEACDRAYAMAVAGPGLTSLTTRCAGKLLECMIALPSAQLRPHWDAIVETAQSNKIFFRINLNELRDRFRLLDRTADELAQLLNQSVEGLMASPEDTEMTRLGVRALEALRQQYPDYLDLAGMLDNFSADDAAAQASLRLALTSLAQFPSDQSLEASLGNFLNEPRETILALVIEALVHRGSGSSAQVLVEQYSAASENNQRWIARGLQRMRVHNLAPIIGQMRIKETDELLSKMLLVAEMQQLDPASGPAVAEAMKELQSVSQALIDAGMLYTFVCSPLQENLPPLELEETFRALLERVHSTVSHTSGPHRDMRSSRREQSRQLDRLFNKRRRI